MSYERDHEELERWAEIMANVTLSMLTGVVIWFLAWWIGPEVVGLICALWAYDFWKGVKGRTRTQGKKGD